MAYIIQHLLKKILRHFGADANMKLGVGYIQLVIGIQYQMGKFINGAFTAGKQTAQVHRFAKERITGQRVEFLEEVLPHFSELFPRSASAGQVILHKTRVDTIQSAKRAQTFPFDFFLQNVEKIGQLQRLMK